MLRAKRFDKIKKFFSRNTPPGFGFYLGKNTESIVCFLGERNARKASTPGKDSEPRTGGEPLVCHIQRPYKKSLCKMTNKQL